MNRFVFTSILLYAMCVAHAQKFDKVIVTDVHCFRQEDGEFTSSEQLPFYFHHSEFVEDIFAEIKNQITEKFNIDSIYFLHPNEVKTSSHFMEPDLQSKEYAQEHANKKTLYVEVLTKLTTRVISNGVPRYGFTTKVRAYNYKGKKVYKFNNVIPFETYKDGGITGPVQMGEEDFYAFYFDGLQYAFKGKDKKIDLRYIRKPAAAFYDDFIAESEKFMYLPVKTGFAYGKDVENSKDVLTFDGNFWHSMDDTWNFDNVFSNYNFKEGYNVTNHFNREKYLVKIKGDNKTFFDFLTISSNVSVEFRKGKKETVGEFEMAWDGTFEGEFNGQKYNVKYNWPYNCSEFYNEDKLVAVMNHLDGYDEVYVHQSATEKQLGDLFNLFFAWQYASELQAAVDAKAEEQDD